MFDIYLGLGHVRRGRGLRAPRWRGHAARPGAHVTAAAGHRAWPAGSLQIATIGGPALGGFLFAISPGATYAVVAAFWLLRRHLQWRAAACSACEPSIGDTTLRTLFAGVHFVRGNRTVLGTISLDLFAVLLGGATALLPIFAKDILHTDAFGLGLLRAAPAAGALVTTYFLARRPLAAPRRPAHVPGGDRVRPRHRGVRPVAATCG